MLETIFSLLEEWWFLLLFATPFIGDFFELVNKMFVRLIEMKEQEKKDKSAIMKEEEKVKDIFRMSRKEYGDEIASKVFYEMIYSDKEFDINEYIARCSEEEFKRNNLLAPASEQPVGITGTGDYQTVKVFEKTIDGAIRLTQKDIYDSGLSQEHIYHGRKGKGTRNVVKSNQLEEGNVSLKPLKSW